MASDNTIRLFTAQDIEKYHKGLLSPKERHNLEKAALDDPFLADALEGYDTAGVNVTTDLQQLKNRLAERTAVAKVIPLHGSAEKKSFPWFRAAAMIVLIAGAGVLVYQLGFNKKQGPQDIAQSTNKSVNSPAPSADSNANQAFINSEKTDTVTGTATQGAIANTDNHNSQSNTDYLAKAPVQAERSFNNLNMLADSNPALYQKDRVAFTEKPDLKPEQKADTAKYRKDMAANGVPQFGATSDFKVTTEAAKKEGGRDLAKIKADNESKAKSVASADTKEKQESLAEGYAMNDKARGITSKSVPAASRRENNQYYKSANTFRGFVTDANNNALPFANVTNLQDNIGTYADARGQFVLTSTDSVLNVQVRSNGFNNNNITLRNNVPSNKIVLQEDKNLAVQTLRPGKVNYEKRRYGNMKLEGEPEPEDGWDNYDSYLSNNLNIPDEAMRGKPNSGGSVEVSFEVNKFGEPVKFVIEKSLCDKCDQEAIRLIKEGPKWKRKAKKGRTTVTISF
jgi:hypothetical protein